MAVTDNITALISDVVNNLRDTGTIISESLTNQVLTLELSSLYSLAVGEYIDVNSILYKIIALDAGAVTVDVVAEAVTSETVFYVPTPYFFSGTAQMINKYLNGKPDPLITYPCVLLFDVFKTKRIEDPTSPYSREPQLFIAFLNESSIDMAISTQNDIIDPLETLAENFITELKANPYVGRFDDYELTRHANFGVFAAGKGHTITTLDHELSGVVIEITPPIYETFEGCETPITTIKCAPSFVVDTLVLPTPQELTQGQTYECTVCPPVIGKAYLRQAPFFNSTNWELNDVGWNLANGFNFWAATQGYIPVLESDNILLLDSTISNNENAFGNYNRITNDLGGTVTDGSDGSTANYMIDHLTGKGYAINHNNAYQTWQGACATALTRTVGPYTGDFRIMSSVECLELSGSYGGVPLIIDVSVQNNIWIMNGNGGTNALFFRITSVIWANTTQWVNRAKSSGASSIGYGIVRNHY